MNIQNAQLLRGSGRRGKRKSLHRRSLTGETGAYSYSALTVRSEYLISRVTFRFPSKLGTWNSPLASSFTHNKPPLLPNHPKVCSVVQTNLDGLSLCGKFPA